LARGTIATPVGDLHMAAGPRGLVSVRWTDGADPFPAPGAAQQAPRDEPGATARAGSAGVDRTAAAEGPAQRWLELAAGELAEYFAGARMEFTVPVDPAGTPYQRRAWEVLRTIPFGRTMSYGEQATALGSPGGARAVGSANGRNPIPIIVPCHRVVAASGALGGYSSGPAHKRWLLAHERQVLQRGAGSAVPA
jgi:methylated-DNA-[protein]-cysteine S-methyltransferase